VFFLLACDGDRLHLPLPARLCSICHRTDFLDRLRRCATAEEMVAAALAAERKMLGAPPPVVAD